MVRTLGVGSFGRVKYAKYKQDGQMYAVKFMKKQEIIKLKQVDHINNEKRLMAQIDYPFIVNMIGYSKDDRFIYIVMECIGGGELFVHLRRAVKILCRAYGSWICSHPQQEHHPSGLEA